MSLLFVGMPRIFIEIERFSNLIDLIQFDEESRRKIQNNKSHLIQCVQCAMYSVQYARL